MTKTVGVVGAGLMGAEIALVFALAGRKVIITDRDSAALNGARNRIEATLARGVSRNFYSTEAAEAAGSAIATTLEMNDLADCELVTEAVFEDRDVKASVLGRIDEICSSETVVATNTSTIPISTLAAKVSPARRARFIGTHYFSPASRMKLVEIIPGFETAETTTAQVTNLVTTAGKTPIRVKDVAGFAVNRVLHAFMIEAVRLVEEGVATPEDIDTACRLGLGHPLGPFELMDATTSSLCLQAQEVMQEAYGERFRPRPLLKQRVRAGLVGGKGRPGWRSALKAEARGPDDKEGQR